MMQINSMSDEVYALYQEGYECFHRLFNISPTGVRMYMNRQEGDPDYDPEHGIACYKKAVELGSADAMFELANYYREGMFVEQDYKKAVLLYAQAAAKGSSSARANLAWAYVYGQGVDADREEAMRIFKQEEKTDASSKTKYNIGLAYLQTCGSKEDAKLAIEWLKKASEKGSRDANEVLGECYCGVALDGYMEKDYAKADYYLEKAIADHSTNAAYRLGVNIILGQSQIQDLDRAEELLEKAWRDMPDAYYALFVMYSNEDSDRHNPQRALDCLRKAAEAGSEMALEDLDEYEEEVQNGGENDTKMQKALSQLTGIDYKEGFNTISQMAQDGDDQAQYELGKILPMNKSIAYEWFDRAAASENADALLKLSEIYNGGDGNETRQRNIKYAIEYAERAANSGHAKSQLFLAMLYMTVDGISGNKRAEAPRLAQAAYENGILDGLYVLGCCYGYGTGVREDSKKAYDLFVEYIDIAIRDNVQGLDGLGTAAGIVGNWHFSGTNVKKDYELAAKYLQIALDNGNESIRANLAIALKKKDKKGLFGIL